MSATQRSGGKLSERGTYTCGELKTADVHLSETKCCRVQWNENRMHSTHGMTLSRKAGEMERVPPAAVSAAAAAAAAAVARPLAVHFVRGGSTIHQRRLVCVRPVRPPD